MNGLMQVALVLILMSVSGAAIAASADQTAPARPEDAVLSQQESVSKPIQMVRTLQLMQDQIAVGSTEAHLGQRGLLTILDDRYMALDQEVWMDSKNVRAAIAFVLSGGDPQILRKLLGMGDPSLPFEHRAFVGGTLAYVGGGGGGAKSKTLSIEV